MLCKKCGNELIKSELKSTKNKPCKEICVACELRGLGWVDAKDFDAKRAK